MNKSMIIHLPPGRTADTAFLAEAVVKFPTVFSFALQADGKLENEVYKSSWDVKQIEELLAGTMDGHRVLFMGNWPKYENEDDIPPFCLRDGDDNPFLGIFYEGDSSSFAGLNDNHTEEYNASEEIIFPRLEKAYKDAGGDFDKFIEELRGAAVQRTLKTVYKHRGQFILLPKVGEPIIFGDNEIGAEYSWGTVSNVEGLSYKEAAPAVKETSPLSFLDRMRGKKAEASPPPPPAPDVKNVLPLKKTETAPPKEPENKVVHTNLVEMMPPKGLQSGARNFWFRLFNAKDPGQLPGDHQSKESKIWVLPEMVDFAKRNVSNTKEMRKLADDIKKAKSGDHSPTTNDTGKSTTREPATNYVNTSTVLDVKDKEKAVNLLSGFLDKKMSPLEIQKSEAKWPMYSSECGVNFEELLFLSADQIMALTDGNKPATAMIIEFRRKYIESSGVKLEDLVRPGSKGEEPKDTNTEVVNDRPTEKPAAAQGGGLSFLRRKTG